MKILIEFATIINDKLSYDNLITTGGLIIVALITTIGSIQIAIANRTREHAKKTREQTENAHGNTSTPNLRDNIDVNQKRVVNMLNTVMQIQLEQGHEISEQRKDITKLVALTDDHTDQIDELTHDKPHKKEE